MRIFLVQSVQGLWPTSGEWVANLNFLKFLANHGHTTAQVCYGKPEEIARSLAESEIAPPKDSGFQTQTLELDQDNQPPVQLLVTKFHTREGILMIVLDRDSFQEHLPTSVITKELEQSDKEQKLTAKLEQFMRFLIDEIMQFKATHVLFSDAISLRATAMRPGIGDVKLIYVVHCAEQLPVGPYVGILPDRKRDPAEMDLIRKADGIWSVSRAVSRYAKKYGQLDTTPLPHHIWSYLDDKQEIPPPVHNWSKKHIGMVNPCSFKGLGIFLRLAERLPQFQFVAWESWAPDEDEMKQMDKYDNIEKRPGTADTNEIWSTVKLLLVPSLWFEAWGMVVTEAQLRGIPVVSSSAGGIPEAKVDVPYIIPMTPMTGQHQQQGTYPISDEDIEHWAEAVETLMTNKEVYEQVAHLAREKTIEWIQQVGEDAQEQWLDSFQ